MSALVWPRSIWFIGCGAMAGAILRRWLDVGLDPASVTVVDPALPDLVVRVLAALPDEAAPELLVLGVKPQSLDSVAGPVANAVGPDTTIVSILAGTRLATLVDRFRSAGRVVRVMPNLPVALGQGVVALHSPGPQGALAALMAPLGLVEWIDDEGLFDAVTALSGSGPAFVYRFADALAKGGAAMGLDSALADRLARATVAGAAAVAQNSPDPLAALADRVASKGGSTRLGLDVLDAEDELATLVARALAAAEARNRELAGR